ncbi:MAG: prepilin peptidase [Planctomycetes bacterium]|nr:prepilin peptidase [Planctomycetota bacterium]
MSPQQVAALLGLINLIVLFGLLITASYTDVVHRKIYNWATYPAVGIGLALGFIAGGLGSFPWIGSPGVGLLDRVSGLLLGFTIFAVFNLARAVGTGDVKLMAAIGALTGAHFTLWAMFWGSLVGAIMAMWILVMRGQLMRGIGRSLLQAIRIGKDDVPEDATFDEAPEKARMAYGVALSFGTLLAWFLNTSS